MSFPKIFMHRKHRSILQELLGIAIVKFSGHFVKLFLTSRDFELTSD